MKEIWKPIPIDPWDTLYEVSNLGRVRYAPNALSMRTINGYNVVTLRKQGVKYTAGVHRLVAAAFIRPPKTGEVVNHINADRKDNSIKNIEWVTQGENCTHTAKIGRTARWPRHPWAKINPAIAIEMRTAGAGLRTIADRFGCSIPAVSHLLIKAKKEGKFSDPRE